VSIGRDRDKRGRDGSAPALSARRRAVTIDLMWKRSTARLSLVSALIACALLGAVAGGGRNLRRLRPLRRGGAAAGRAGAGKELTASGSAAARRQAGQARDRPVTAASAAAGVVARESRDLGRPAAAIQGGRLILVRDRRRPETFQVQRFRVARTR
jgi:hypothetical protein